MLPRREDFGRGVQRVVAERAGYLCSNPDCRRLTIGPHSIDAKSLSVGVASHIAAAAPGGPRFRQDQTPEERRSLDNAIWLCHSCSDLVDKDQAAYPEQRLVSWRRVHEEFIRQGGGYPELPRIALLTHHGLALPKPAPGRPVVVSGDAIQRFRSHQLSVTNPNRSDIRFLTGRLQLGEPVTHGEFQSAPAGINLSFERERIPLVAWGTAGATAIHHPGDGASPNILVSAEPIPPGVTINLTLTSRPEESPFGPPPDVPDFGTDGLRYFMAGDFQYEWHGERIRRPFVVPLTWDGSARTHGSQAVEERGAHGLIWERRLF